MKKQISKSELIDADVLLEHGQSDDQNWLFKPENKEALEKVKEGLKQKGTINHGSFSAYLEE